MRITKLHMFRAGGIGLLFVMLFFYQNCGNVNIVGQQQEASAAICADENKELLVLPTNSIEIAPATAFRVYERTSEGSIIEFIPQDDSTSWTWLRDNQQANSNEIFSLGRGRTELRTEIDLENCSASGINISARVQVCGVELPLITETYIPEECREEEEESPPPTTQTTLPDAPPQPTTANIPGWTGGAAERCDSDSNTHNEPEPAVPIQCVAAIPTLTQAYVDLPGEPGMGEEPLADSRIFRNMNQTYLQTGYCRNSAGNTYRPLNNGEFYSLRFVAQENEISSAAIVTNAMVIVTISECPGDFGGIQENWPRVNSTNGKVRTLKYYSDNIHKQRNQKGYRSFGSVRNDYCTWSGADTNLPILRWGSGTRVSAETCNLIPGKTYYMNIVMRRSDNNMPGANSYLPGREMKMTVDRSCPGLPNNKCQGISID